MSSLDVWCEMYHSISSMLISSWLNFEVKNECFFSTADKTSLTDEERIELNTEVNGYQKELEDVRNSSEFCGQEKLEKIVEIIEVSLYSIVISVVTPRLVLILVLFCVYTLNCKLRTKTLIPHSLLDFSDRYFQFPPCLLSQFFGFLVFFVEGFLMSSKYFIEST